MKGARHDQKLQADSAGEPTGRDDGNTLSLEMKVTFREAPSLAKTLPLSPSERSEERAR